MQGEDSESSPRLTHIQRCAVAILVAVATSAVYFFQTDIINTDAIRYISCAQHIERGEWLQAKEYTPMYFVPYLIFCVHCVIPDWILAAQIVSMVAMILVIVPFYFLVNDLFGAKYSFFSTMFFALTPQFREISVMIVRDPVFIFFTVSFLWCVFRSCSHNWKYHFPALLSCFLTTLSRLEGIVVLVVYLFIVFWQSIHANNSKIRKLAWAMSIGILILFASIAYKYHHNTGNFNRINEVLQAIRAPVSYYHSWKVHNIVNELRKMETESYVVNHGHGGDIIRTSRQYIWGIALFTIVRSCAECAFHIIFFLGVLGIYACFPLCADKKILYLFLWLLFFFSLPYIFLLKEDFVSTRYVLASAVVLCCWSGKGFFYVWEKVQQKFVLSSRWMILLAALLFLCPCIKILRCDSGDENLKKAGTWIKEQNLSHKKIITNDLRILFYAGVRVNPSPEEIYIKSSNVELLWQRAKDTKADIITWRGESSARTPIKVIPGKKKHVFIYEFHDDKEKK